MGEWEWVGRVRGVHVLFKGCTRKNNEKRLSVHLKLVSFRGQI